MLLLLNVQCLYFLVAFQLYCHVMSISTHWLWALVPRISRKKESYSWPIVMMQSGREQPSWCQLFKAILNLLCTDFHNKILLHMLVQPQCCICCILQEMSDVLLVSRWLYYSFGFSTDLVPGNAGSCSNWVIFEIKAISKDSQLTWFSSIGQVPLVIISGVEEDV